MGLFHGSFFKGRLNEFFKRPCWPCYLHEKKANALVRREEQGLWYEKKVSTGGSRQTMKNDPNKGSILYTTGTSTKKT